MSEVKEVCPKCGNVDFAILRDMTSRRVCKCSHTWDAPEKKDIGPHLLVHKELWNQVNERYNKLKSDYDDLKNKLAQYESGDLPTWKSEHDILKEVCDSLDKSNQEFQKDLGIVRDSHKRQGQLNDALYLKQIQLENQNEDLKSKLEKAEAVISFYADKRHWDYTRIQIVEDMEMHGFGYLGGLKAREYIKGEG